MKASCPEAAIRLEDIPNIGPSIADDLRALDIFEPLQLVEAYKPHHEED